MVIVSHRLSSLTECDQILVLEQGKILDIAPHDVLLERCSRLSPALDAAEPPSRRAGRAAGADPAGDGAVELRYEIPVLSREAGMPPA